MIQSNNQGSGVRWLAMFSHHPTKIFSLLSKQMRKYFSIQKVKRENIDMDSKMFWLIFLVIKNLHSFSDYQLINCLPRDGFLCLVLLIRFIIIILHALLELIAFFLSIFFCLKIVRRDFFPLILHFAKGSIIISENEEILKFPCFSFYLYLNVFKLYLLLKSLHFCAHSFLCVPEAQSASSSLARCHPDFYVCLSQPWFYFLFFLNQLLGGKGGTDDWRESMAARCGCGGVWSLRALLPQNGRAERQAGRCMCMPVCVCVFVCVRAGECQTSSSQSCPL